MLIRRRVLRATLLTASATLAACGRGSASVHAVTAVPRTSTPARVTPLVIRVDPHGDAVAVMVRGTVDGHPVRFAIDSGSSGHILAMWVVRRFGLATSASTHVRLGIDGSSVPTPTVDHTAMALEGWGAIGSEPIDVVDLPADFETIGVGGVLSPQRLATPGTELVIDMPGRAMSLRAHEDAASLLAAQPQPLVAGPLAQCRVSDGGWLFIAPGTVAGVSERLIIDTGSTDSVVLIDSTAGQRVRARAHADQESPAEGVGGLVTTQSVPGVEIAVGEVRRSTRLELRQALPQPCPIDGMLGLDVLQDCVLTFAADGLRGRCSSE